MRYRPLLGVLAMGVLSMPLVSCINSPSLTSITISPTTMDFGGAGLTAQLTATGYYTHPDHAAETKDITSQVSNIAICVVSWPRFIPCSIFPRSASIAAVRGRARTTG